MVLKTWKSRERPSIIISSRIGAPIAPTRNLIWLAFLYLYSDTSTWFRPRQSSHSQLRRSRLNLELASKLRIVAGLRFPLMSEEHNRNPTGRNQFPNRRKLLIFVLSISFCFKHFILVVQADNPLLQEALQKYHREGKTSNPEISQRLLAEYNITLRYDHCIVLIYRFLFTVAIVLGQSSGDVGTSACTVVWSQPAICLIKRRSS
jgi:hypothetical protein